MKAEKRPFALVVEDMAEVAEIIQLYLERLGIDSHHAPDARAAFDYLKESRPDFIVLDIGMPVTSGWDFLQVIRADDDLSDLPVTVLTAYTDPDSRSRGQGLKISAYLKKPLIFDQLKQAVNVMLEQDSRV